MKKLLILAATIIAGGVSALVHAQPYVDPPVRTPAPRIAELPSAASQSNAYVAVPVPMPVKTPAPRVVELPSAASQGSAYVAAPVAAVNSAASIEREPSVDGEESVPRRETRSSKMAPRVGNGRSDADDRPTAYDRSAVYDRPAASVRPQGYRSAKFAGGEGSTWKTGRDSHGFAAMIGGCRISGFAGPNGYRLNRSC